jgi:hypothetical protein
MCSETSMDLISPKLDSAKCRQGHHELSFLVDVGTKEEHGTSQKTASWKQKSDFDGNSSERRDVQALPMGI